MAALVCSLLGAGGCGHGAARRAAPVLEGSPPAVSSTAAAAAPGEARAAAGAPAAARRDAAVSARPRIVVLPVDNMTGGQAAVKELGRAVEAEMRRRFDVVSSEEVEEFLSRHRLRYTGGIDGEAARAAQEELGADAVLITSLLTHRAASPPTIALAMRLVAAGNEPTILWMDQAARAGNESPGLLGLGIVETVEPLQHEMIQRLVESLRAALERDGRRPARCGGGLWYRPRVRFRSPMLDSDERYTLAVIPFFEQTRRRGAGDALALELVRQLVATGRYRVLEPGVVRQFLLQRRVIMPGGVSLEATRLLLGALGVQLVASGTVLDYTDNGGLQGSTIRFSLTLLDGGSGEVVWHSTSSNRGDDGVFMFGLGRIVTAGALTCRMVGGVVDQLTRGGSSQRVVWRQDPVRAAIDRREPNDGRDGPDSTEEVDPGQDGPISQEGP